MQPFEKTPDAVTGRRISAVDYAKTFAILCVVVIHVSSEVLLGRQIGSAAWLEGLFWSSLARGAVPMFLMCSGVLFMDRSGGLSVRHIWNRNIPHILLALFVWAAVYKVIPRFLHEKLTAEACIRFCWNCCAASMRAICISCISCYWYMLHCRLHTRLQHMQMKKRSATRCHSGFYMACCFQRSKVSGFSKRFPAFFCNGRSRWPGVRSAAPGWGIF